MDGEPLALHPAGFLQQLGDGLVARRKTLHLSVLHRTAAVHVVVAHLSTHHDIAHVDVVTVATSTATRHNHVGLVLAYHLGRSQGGIHLADTTLLHDHAVVTEQVLQLLQFLVHCHDNSYFHVSFPLISACKGTKICVK